MGTLASAAPGFELWADAISDAGVVLHANAVRAGLGSAVPTCPGWTVRDLLAHQGMVHRWAREIVAGTSPQEIDTDALEREGLASADLVDWVDDGIEALLRTLDRTDPDEQVWFFLPGAGSPVLGWTRRQCHETTIHAVDALAAALGRPPAADEVWFGPGLAADGVDELLTGFLPRRGLRLPERRRVLVRSEDNGDAWTVDFAGDEATATADELPDPDTVLTGTAVQLYLALWNRGVEVAETGLPLLESWSAGQRVTW